MLRDQKQELIDKAHERAVERNISLGLPVYIPTEEEKKQEKIDNEQKKREARKKLAELEKKMNGKRSN